MASIERQARQSHADILGRIRKEMSETSGVPGPKGIGGYRPEKATKGAHALLNALDRWQDTSAFRPERVMPLIRRLDYDLEDVKAFLPYGINRSKSSYFGYFVSEAINKVIRDNDTITLKVGRTLPYGLGYGLSRGTIKVLGVCGLSTGEEMSGGELRIEGNAGGFCGHRMTGGSISIKGEAMEQLGARMEDGSIEVYGNVGTAVGWKSRGGRIDISGEMAEKVGSDCWAAVYHKGTRLNPTWGLV